MGVSLCLSFYMQSSSETVVRARVTLFCILLLAGARGPVRARRGDNVSRFERFCWGGETAYIL